MKLPDYNPDGRKLTWEQHVKLRREYEEKKEAEKKNSNEPSGRCSKCNKAKFRLRVSKGDLIRTCKECGHELVF
jgi:ssDNA-binding Zn-finger/Zn-ribbon topoisomerase 1